MARERDSRTPPHNLEAEASLLGAALLSRHAVEALAEVVTVDDFYKPAHQHIAAAILRLAANDLPVDVVMVQDALGDLLADAGGTEYLMHLMTATPAITNARRYGRIVHDAGTLRRILHASSRIADAAYNANDPATALAEVVGIVDDLGSFDPGDYSTLEIADITAILAGDMRPEQPDYLTRSDGASLLYAGKMHMFQAEPTAGKTWVALFAVLEILGLGGSVIYIDFEDTPRGIIGRLLILGVKPEVLRDRFRYVQPIGAFGPAERTRLHALLAELNPDLVVIDGVGEALARDGLSEDKAPDVVGWIERLPRPIARTGAAVLMIDHVVKNKEEQGRWARGSSAKLGVIDGASLQLKVVTPFSRQRVGKVKIIVAKDRPGGVGALGECVGIVTITPHADGERVVITLDPNVEEVRSTDTWKPTHIMERVSGIIEDSATPLTATGIKAMLAHTKPTLVSQAIARLVSEGYVTESTSGRTKTLSNVRRYTDGATIHHLHSVPPPTDDDYEPPPLFPNPDEEF